MTDHIATVTTNPTNEKGIDLLAELNQEYDLYVDAVIGGGHVAYIVEDTVDGDTE